MKYDMDYIHKILTTYSEQTFLYGAASESRIWEAETELDLIFPAEYRIFLQRYGAVEFGSLEIYGILPEAPASVPNAVWTTQKLRRDYGLSHTCVVIGFDGFGGYLCLETGDGDSSPVVVFQLPRETEAPTGYERLYNSFAEYLFEELKEEARSFLG